jgi:hypothetical protein
MLRPALPVPARKSADGRRRHRVADANCSLGFSARAILAGVQHVAIGMVESVPPGSWTAACAHANLAVTIDSDAMVATSMSFVIVGILSVAQVRTIV